MEKIRRHYLFLGQVQGVGFRWRRKSWPVCWILPAGCGNLWDGTVEMEVQGTREDIREMLCRLRDQRFIHIEEIREKNLPLEEENGFRAR